MANNVNINRITNANVYVDGANLLGEAEEVTIPGIKVKMTDHKGLGMFGTAEFPAGIDKLEAKIKWTSIYLDSELLAATPFRISLYQVRGSIENYGPSGLNGRTPGLWLLSATLKESGDLTFKQHENVDKTTTLTVYHLEQWVGSIQTLLYDVQANVYAVDGIDQLAEFRAQIGG
jgi:Bacteriophage tail tube protein